VPLETPHRRSRRLLGLFLIAYGVLGLAVLVGGALLINEPLERLSRSTGSLEEQRTLLVRSLRSTSQTFGGAAQGMLGFDESLAQARASSSRAAALTRDVSGTMRDLARSMAITIFNTQPLLSLSTSFERAAQQLTSLGDDLDAIGASLDQNAGDARVTRENLQDLQRQVDLLADSVEETELPSVPGDALGAVRISLLLLTAWLSMLALGSLLLGLYLWLPRRRSIPP
jgi:hypothetical protein